jgi:hypothetical protein
MKHRRDNVHLLQEPQEPWMSVLMRCPACDNWLEVKWAWTEKGAVVADIPSKCGKHTLGNEQRKKLAQQLENRIDRI